MAAPLPPIRVRTTSTVENGTQTLVTTWDQPSIGDAATSHNLRIRESGLTAFEIIENVSSPFAIEGLDPGVRFYVQVQAINADGESSWAPSPGIIGQQAPSSLNAPTSLRATNVTETSLTLHWSYSGQTNPGSTEGASLSFHYRYWNLSERGGSGWGRWWYIADVSSGARSVNISGLPPGDLIAFQVQVVYDDFGANTRFSPPSVALNVRMSSAVAPGKPGTPVVTTPTETMSGSGGGLTITWSAPTTGSPVDNYLFEIRRTGTTQWASAQPRAGEDDQSPTILQTDTHGVSFDVRVQARNAGGDSPWSDAGTGTSSGLAPGTSPGQVRSLAAIALPTSPHNSARVTWQPPASGTTPFTYEINWDIYSDFRNDNSATATASPYIITGLDPSTRYYIRVRATNAHGNGFFASSVQVTTSAGPNPPTVPENIVAAALDTDSIRIAWSVPTGFGPNTGGATVTGYTVRWRAGTSGDWTLIENITATTIDIDSLAPNTLHQMQVQAHNDGGSSDFAPDPPVTATTRQLALPTAPNNVVLSQIASDADSLRATWTAVIGAASYQGQYKKSADSTWTDITGNITSPYQIDGLDTNTAYDFRVRATNAAGSSDYSSHDSATTAELAVNYPTGLAGERIDDTTLRLTWDAFPGATSYDLQERATGNPFWGSQVSVGTTTATRRGRARNTSYDYRVRARISGGNSEWSPVIAVSTANPDQPPEITLVTRTDNRVFGSRIAGEDVTYFRTSVEVVNHTGNTLSYAYTQTGGITITHGGTTFAWCYATMPVSTASEQTVTLTVTVTDTVTNLTDSDTLTLLVQPALADTDSLFSNGRDVATDDGLEIRENKQPQHHTDSSFSLIDSRAQRTRINTAIPASYIIGGGAAFITLLNFLADGGLRLRLGTTNNASDTGAGEGPQLTDAAEQNLALAWLLPDGTAYKIALSDLVGSDTTEPYTWPASAVTAAGITNNTAFRNKHTGFWTARVILIDRNGESIDYNNLRVTDAPDPTPTDPTPTDPTELNPTRTGPENLGLEDAIIEAQKTYSVRARATLTAHAYDSFNTTPYDWKVVSTRRPSFLSAPAQHFALAAGSSVIRAFTLQAANQCYIQEVNPASPNNWHATAAARTYAGSASDLVSNPVLFIWQNKPTLAYITGTRTLRYAQKTGSSWGTLASVTLPQAASTPTAQSSLHVAVRASDVLLVWTDTSGRVSAKVARWGVTSTPPVLIANAGDLWQGIGIRADDGERPVLYMKKTYRLLEGSDDTETRDGQKSTFRTYIAFAEIDETQAADDALQFNFDENDNLVNFSAANVIDDPGETGYYHDATVAIHNAHAQPAPGGGWHIWYEENQGFSYDSIGRLNDEHLTAEPVLYPEWGTTTRLDNPIGGSLDGSDWRWNNPIISTAIASDKAYLAAANWIAEGTPYTKELTADGDDIEYDVIAYKYTRKVIGLGDAAIGIGQSGSTQLVQPTRTVGIANIELQQREEGVDIKAADVLKIVRLIEAPDTEGGTRPIYLRAIRVNNSPSRVKIEAVDAAAYMGIQRSRRPLNFRIQSMRINDIVRRIVARSGIDLTLHDSTPQIIGGELVFEPNHHYRANLIDLARLSHFWHIRPNHNTGFEVEIIVGRQPAPTDYSYYEPPGDGPPYTTHPIMEPISNDSIEEPGLSVVSGSWSDVHSIADPQDPIARSHAWAAQLGYRVAGFPPRSIWNRNTHLFNRLRLIRSSLVDKLIMQAKRNIATIETIGNIGLGIHDTIRVTSDLLGWDDKGVLVTLILETYDQALFLQKVGVSEPPEHVHAYLPTEAAQIDHPAIVFDETAYAVRGREDGGGDVGRTHLFTSDTTATLPGRYFTDGQPHAIHKLRLETPDNYDIFLQFAGNAALNDASRSLAMIITTHTGLQYTYLVDDILTADPHTPYRWRQDDNELGVELHYVYDGTPVPQHPISVLFIDVDRDDVDRDTSIIFA